ncbi:hypothetical protein IL306_015195 [Fusarium sp. DS 682]|nr:hypothetical protein IL306_015195 [Fusarium sp. DS 682]
MAASPWSKQEDADVFLQAYACDNPSGDSILHLSVRKDCLELTRNLLEAGFPVDTLNDDGKTPLHLAAEFGLVDTSQLLMAYGANVLVHQRPPGDDSDEDLEASVDSASTHSDDDTSAPTASRTPKFPQLQKPPSPFELAFDRGDDALVGLFVKHALLKRIDTSEEYTMLQFMAKAFVAKRKGVLEAFREIGWDIDHKHSHLGRPFLHYVCEEAEDTGPVELLIKSGADVTGADLGGATGLHLAAQLGRCSDGSVVKCLIAAGARVSAKDKVWGGNPLGAAIQGQKIANVRVLLEAGSDVNLTVRRGDMRRSLLHLAAQDGIPEMVQLLLDWGANPNALDEMGATSARWAIRNNHVEAVRILLEGGLDPNYDNGHSLRMAIEMGRLRIMQLFIQHGATVKSSMIHLARVRRKDNQVPLFELCVKNIASDDEASSDGDSADLNNGAKNTKVRISLDSFNIPTMMTNGGFGDYRLCAVLVEHGHGKGLADLEAVPRALLICICAEHGFTKAISRLLEISKISGTIRRFGVRPFGWTALHVAARMGNASLVEELCSHGWSLADEDSLGRSALDLAAYWGHAELVQKLLAAHCIAEHRDGDGQTPLHYAVSGAGRKDCRLLEYLVAAGCDVSKASASGETALHRAARFNGDPAAAWLLGRGSSVSATDRFLNTPLHIAAYFNAVTVIKTLLSYGAQLNGAAVDGRTPLHCASQAGAGDAVAALLDAGADPNKTDRREHTALATAIYWGACELRTIDALLERTKVNWSAPRAAHLVITAALAVKSQRRASIFGRVIKAIRAAAGEEKACRIIKRLLPEMVPEILVCADDTDRGSPADVIPLLLDFLPDNGQTRHTALFHMLLAVIKHGGDDDGHVTRRLLLLDESNVTQAIPGNWGLQHLCCRYGRLKQLRVLLGLGLSPWSRSVIDGETCTPENVASKFSPGMLPQFMSLLEGAHVLGNICHQDPTVFPMLRRALGTEHLAREVNDLSDVFKRGSEKE